MSLIRREDGELETSNAFVFTVMVSDSKFHQSLNGLDENPLRRAWRGNKEGTIELASVPKFDSPYDEREWIKVCH